MTALFWTSALAIVGLAWSLLWAGQRRALSRPDAGGRNALLIDEEITALDAERAAGAIDADRHREAVVGLQRRLLAESAADAGSASVPATSPRLLAGLAIALPVFVAAGYLALGNPAGLHVAAPAAPAADDVSRADVERMVDALARRLEASPPGRLEDLQGWVMLARSQAALQRFGAAAAAYERAVALAPDDAQLPADLADVLTVLQAPGAGGGGVATAARPPTADRVAVLVARALALDPQNPKALALAGNAAFERHDTGAAIDDWRRARALAPAGSEFADALDRNLADAGAPPDAQRPQPDSTRSTVAAWPTTSEARSAAAGRSLTGDIRVAAALAGRVGPDDTLFVFARAVDGPRMPLAIVRRKATTQPDSFVLDDSMAMSPELRLSNFGAVVVGARISRSGNALPQPGDLVGEAHADAGSGRLSIVIDRVQP